MGENGKEGNQEGALREWEGGWGCKGRPPPIISLAFLPLAVMKGNYSTSIWCSVSAQTRLTTTTTLFALS